MSDPSLYDLAGAVLLAVEAGSYAEALPARRYVSNGEVAWDLEDVCAAIAGLGGQVTVRVVRSFTHAGVLAAEIPAAMGFVAGLGAEIEIQVMRCVPIVDTAGDYITVPSPSEIEASAAVILSDASDVFAAVLAAYRSGDLPGCSGVAYGGWVGAGPQGGIGGGSTTILVDQG